MEYKSTWALTDLLWDVSLSDWLHNTASLPNSAILRAIRGPVIFMTSWATFLSVLHLHWSKSKPLWAQAMCIPQAPHSLMVSALSLLLVFKQTVLTNDLPKGERFGRKSSITRGIYIG